MLKTKEQFLLFRIRAFKDQNAFRMLVDEHGPKIQKFLDYKLPTVEDAEDAYAQTWLRLWEYATDTKIESFSGIAFTIARSVAAQFYRKRDREKPTVSTSEHIHLSITDDSHEGLIDRIDVDLLRTVLTDLDDDESQVIYMRYIEGYKVKEIAEFLGKTDNATSVFLHRTVKKIKDIFEDKFPNV